MKAVIFWICYPSIWILSILPFRLLYLFSDVCYLLVYYLIGYRKKTVKSNLKIAFPEKSDEERLHIEKKFYRHMCDMFLEMIKSMNITEKQLLQRSKPTNVELVEKYDRDNQSYIMLLGHYASYEWVFALQLYVKQPGYGIYKTIKNKQLDNLIRKIRSRWNTYLLDSKKAIRTINDNQKEGKSAIYGFVADQSPRLKRAHFWTLFLGQEVPFFTGAERMSKQFNFPVVYYNVEKKQRGHYEGTFYNLIEKDEETEIGSITTKYAELLEKQIHKEPAYYLWTHKRFKLVGRKEEALAILKK